MKLEERRSEWILLEKTDSTNTHLLRQNAPSGAVCLTRRQTAGRGRGGNVWIGKEESSFLFSAVVDLELNSSAAEHLLLIPLLCGIVTRQAALRAHREIGPGLVTNQPLNPEGLMVKWPNDLYLQRDNRWGKLAGILVESQVGPERIRVVMGVGLNWSGVPPLGGKQEKIPGISLFEEETGIPDPWEFATYWIGEFNARGENLTDRGWLDLIAEIDACFYLKNRVIETGHDRYLVQTLTSEGGLLLERLDNGERVVLFDAPGDLRVLT